MADTYIYTLQMEQFSLAAAVSVAFNDPKRVTELRPGYGEIELEDVHPMLRPKTKA